LAETLSEARTTLPNRPLPPTFDENLCRLYGEPSVFGFLLIVFAGSVRDKAESFLLILPDLGEKLLERDAPFCDPAEVRAVPELNFERGSLFDSSSRAGQCALRER
jgi:hypothetical protein